jgi:hypothetical protein
VVVVFSGWCAVSDVAAFLDLLEKPQLVYQGCGVCGDGYLVLEDCVSEVCDECCFEAGGYRDRYEALYLF